MQIPKLYLESLQMTQQINIVSGQGSIPDSGSAHAEWVEPTALSVTGVDIKGAVFIIPLDAPLPNTLNELDIPKGSLYQRIRALATGPEDEFSFVPVSGQELIHLERAWHNLVLAKNVMVLTGLPGAHYDVVFTQATRIIGVRMVDWPALEQALTNRVIKAQRTRDKEPWKSSPEDESLSMQRPVKTASRRSQSADDYEVGGPAHLPVPGGDEDETET